MTHRVGLARDPRPARRHARRPAASRATRSTPSSAAGDIIARARDGRDRDRHHRRQRDERLHRLAVAAGRRPPDQAGLLGARSSPCSASCSRCTSSTTATSPATSRTSCCSSATGSRRSSASSSPTGGCAAGSAPTSAGSSTSRGCRPAPSPSSPLVVGFLVGDPVPELVARVQLGRTVQLRHRDVPPRRRLAYYVGGVVAFVISTGSAAPPGCIAVEAAAATAERVAGRVRGRLAPGSVRPPAGSAAVDDRRRGRASRRGRRSRRRRDPQAVDRAGTLDQPLERDGARGPAGDERVVRQHEQPALVDERLELERPAGEDVGRAGDDARAGDPGQVVVGLPVVERPVDRQLDERRRARLARTSRAGTDGRRPSAPSRTGSRAGRAAPGVSYVSSQFGRAVADRTDPGDRVERRQAAQEPALLARSASAPCAPSWR